MSSIFIDLYKQFVNVNLISLIFIEFPGIPWIFVEFYGLSYILRGFRGFRGQKVRGNQDWLLD